MARSLQVKHEESPTTSPLLTAFLLLAFGWLALSGLVAMAQDQDGPDASGLYAE